MGNCLRRESPTQWGGDDWGSPAPDGFFIGNARHGMHEKDDMMMMVDGEEEEEGLLGGKGGLTSSSTITRSSSTTEVKIKITKKQLEELLGRVDLKELSVQQVVAQLMNISEKYETNHRSWRPNLQSIPE